MHMKILVNHMEDLSLHFEGIFVQNKTFLRLFFQ